MEIGAIRHTEGCENYAEIERRQTPQVAMLSAVIGENNGSIRRFPGAKTMIACSRRNDFNERRCSCARDVILILSAPASVSATLAALPSMSLVPLASFFS